jgi:hypothetical protein
LRGEERRVEIGADDAAPLVFGHVDRAARRHHAGIVDQHGDGSERLLGRIEGAGHGAAVGDIGGNCDGAAAGGLDLALHRGQPIGPARHQRHGGTRFRQYLREPHAEPARRAGHQRHLPRQIEQSCRAHCRLDTP